MSAVFELADHTATDLLREAVQKYHRRLSHVTFDVLMTESKIDDDGMVVGDGFPLKVNGYPAYASVKIIGLKDRAAGRSDVEIVIDGNRWPQLPEATQLALLDHELTHLQMDTIQGTDIAKTDDLGRPLLKMRKHDFQFGWFAEVAERHGKSSVEVQQFSQLTDQRTAVGQLWFSFLPDIDAATSAA